MNSNLKFDVFISGKNLDLCVLTEDHALHTDWYQWYNDEESTLYTEHHRYPNTQAKQLQFFKENIEQSQTKIQFGMVDKEGIFFGVISMSNINYISQNAELGIMIGDKRYRSVKYTIEAFSLLFNHAFNTLNLRRLYSGTHTKLLADFYVRFLNFSLEGVLRNHIFKNGKFIDCYLVAILKENFIPISQDALKDFRC